MKRTLLAAGLAFAAASASPAFAAPEKYMLDSGHSQILFSYNHLGYSTTWGLFSGFEGEIMFDQEDPANSSVAVSMPVKSMWTGWEKRDAHLMSPDFFDASDDELVSFTSTSIEVTGDTTANITGDLTINGVTKSVVLDAQLNTASEHPMAKKPWAGFNATTTLKRTEFDVGNFAPYVSDEVTVQISVEAMKAE
ncbi:YceI family protein [uncultured Shimia sp.]|uniref:YceI family protein n=1 Tax=uncultured Shimia sp. TaxID=573152 RepID=UPI0025D914A2|nr:YceI family protein [uncultured Shimia sp.]